MTTNTSKTQLAVLIQDFFCQRLINQRNASIQTVRSYRDTFRLLLLRIEECTGKSPAALYLEDLNAVMILGFLDYLESERGNCARSRNVRLAAIRSFMHYVSFREPASLADIRQVLAIPMKRFEQTQLVFLSDAEIAAILDACDTTTWSGWRDRIMFKTFYNTGARVSEMTGLTQGDVALDGGPFVHLRGKGRKERTVPLWKSTASELANWLRRHEGEAHRPVFPNRTGHRLSRAGVEYRLRLHVENASRQCPSLQHKRVSPHCIRHSTAMRLLQSGVDITVIALWLGHERLETTHAYVHADMTMKERALGRMQDPGESVPRFRPSSDVLAFLESL